MSELENIKETQQQGTQCSCDKETGEKPVTDEKPVEEVKEEPKTPEPVVTGNSKISIIRHEVLDMQVYNIMYQTGVDFSIKNISDVTIATLIFEAIFYDKRGEVLGTSNYRELDLKPGGTRGIAIKSKIIDSGILVSYNVRIVKMTTTDVEKVQIRRKEFNINFNGEVEVTGTLKNISNVEADAAAIATFVNHSKETVGDKVVFVKNIGPGKIKKFSFKFKPQEGDVVDTFNLKVVSNVENIMEEAK